MLSILHAVRRGGTHGKCILEGKRTMYSVKSVVLEIVLASSDTHRRFSETAMTLDETYSMVLRK